MHQEFKQFAQSITSRIDLCNNDPKRIHEYLEIDSPNFYSINVVRDKLHEKIQALLTSSISNETTSNAYDLRKLRDALVFDSVINNVDNSQYLQLLKMIPGHSKVIKPFDDKIAWSTAITYAKDLLFLFGGYSTSGTEDMEETDFETILREDYPVQFDRAIAAKALTKYGCTIKLDKLSLDISGLDELSASIESDIKKIGGITLIKMLFYNLVAKGKYYAEFKRYLITNESTNIPFHARPLIPYGYLLNLAIKYPNESASNKNTKQIVKQIMDKAESLATFTNVRYYSNLDNIVALRDPFPLYIRKLALFDTIYSFPSAGIDTILVFMDRLFHWVDQQKFTEAYGFSIKELIEVTEKINANAPDYGPYIIYISAIKKCMRTMEESKIKAIFQTLAHKAGDANKEYKSIGDYEQIDFGFKPLIEVTDTKFLLADKSWCSIGFYETLAALVREIDSFKEESNNKIGLAIEQLVYDKLAEKNISYAQGKYADGTKPDGELDVLIESATDIKLIEIKKKVLTRKARSGSDVSLIIDLANSLFDAQIQTGRTELLLRKNGFVELQAGDKKTHRIDLKDRCVERIALTQWDFGSFQDRTVINNILEELLSKDFRLINPTPDDEKKFKKIQDKQVTWRAQTKALDELDESSSDFKFFNCWFISLPQLFMVLNYVDGPEQFYEVLRSVKHVSFGSSSFYFEFFNSYIRKLRRTS